MEKDIVITVSNLTKAYKIYNSKKEILLEIISPFHKKNHKDFLALNEVSFDVKKGETFGIIGTNGAGKSTLLKIITGVSAPSSGSAQVQGKVAALLELGAGFNMEYTGFENIYLNGTMMGYSKEEMRNRVDDILGFADIGDFIYQPVKTYSSGMFARLAFAIAINVEPDILIVDEALSVGDAYFQNKCYRKFEKLRDMGTTILFVSHDIHAVKQMCMRVLWLEGGIPQMCGDSVEVCNAFNNSILMKNKTMQADRLGKANEYEIDMLDADTFPPISFSNESLLNGQVEIISCFVEDENLNRVIDCNIHSEYTVSVVFRSKREIKHCIVGFELETTKGLWVINSNTAICDRKGNIPVQPESITRVDFHFQMPALMRGEYIIGAAVSEGIIEEYKVLTWLYNIAKINIINNGANSGVIDVDTNVTIYSKTLCTQP